MDEIKLDASEIARNNKIQQLYDKDSKKFDASDKTKVETVKSVEQVQDDGFHHPKETAAERKTRTVFPSVWSFEERSAALSEARERVMNK